MSSDQILRLRALVRAAELSKGKEQLAARLGITPVTLRLMLEGRFAIPQELFLKTVDLCFNGDPDRH